jgi:hypothetical protein
MKKLSLWILVVLTVLSFVSVQAQFKLAIGGGMGLNLNLHGGSDLPQSGSGVGFAIAGQADMSLSKNIGILTSLYFYDNRSGSYSMTQNYYGTNYTTDVSASIAYFEIEPLFKYTLPTAPVYIIAGPCLGFNVQNSYETKTTGYASQKGTIQDMNTRFELKAGGGYIYPLSRDMRLNGQLTFGYGLTNVQQNVNWKVLSFGLLTSFEFDVVR